MNDDDDGLLWIAITLSIQYIHVQYYCRPSNIITYPAKKDTLHYYISSILNIQYCYISNIIVDHIQYY